MMQQYMDIKAQYPDCMLFFRLGDFYELFLDDAEVGSRVLGITLTARPRGKDGHVPMAGVPFHAADAYLAKLVQAGYKVAICEQMSEPDKKGIVEREVVRIVTPGTVMSDESLSAQKNNYLCALSFGSKKVGCALADISTGSFLTCEVTRTDWQKELDSILVTYEPREVIVSPTEYADYSIISTLSSYEGCNISIFHEWEDAVRDASAKLCSVYRVTTLSGLGIDKKPQGQNACVAALAYLANTQKKDITHLQQPHALHLSTSVVLDRSTISNLELFSTIREGNKKGSLLDTIDATRSAAGARMLRRWLVEPLTNKKAIQHRLDAVEELAQNQYLREDLQKYLSKMYDIERILARFSVNLGIPPELIRLKYSLFEALKIKETLQKCTAVQLKNMSSLLHEQVRELAEYLDAQLLEDPRVDVKKGGVIAEGVDAQLDELRKLQSGDKEWLVAYETKERARTGITTLKVKSNKVFGYYIEISKSHLGKVPSEYERKQTLVNAERFITPELKVYEEKILTAEEQIEHIEVRLFSAVVEKMRTYTQTIQDVAFATAQVDCLASFAQTAVEQRYCKPSIGLSDEIRIIEGRHAVVESIYERGRFVPNDTLLNASDSRLLVITGPNMAGKSVYMRQVALIVLLAHMGSFVPAREAQISLVDRIFVRSGASDFITSGMSTFMVEMVEAATILNHATNKSLIIMDEIGRGTSTYDGISLAWAIAEYLVSTSTSRPKTLFATHYHELQQLENIFPQSIKNVHMAIDDTTDPPTFLHTVLPGGASHSFGVAVAKMAGVPEVVTNRAEVLLAQLESGSMPGIDTNGEHRVAPGFVETELAKIDVNKLTPLEALQLLENIQKKLHTK